MKINRLVWEAAAPKNLKLFDADEKPPVISHLAAALAALSTDIVLFIMENSIIILN